MGEGTESGGGDSEPGPPDADAPSFDDTVNGDLADLAAKPASRVNADTQELVEAMVRERLFAAEVPVARIGRFTVLEMIGSGGMGVVYAAYDAQLDRKVAIKVLRDHRWASEDAQGRFMREAQAMARLSHPNVVTVHEVGISEVEVFLAMEFIRGQNVAEWLESQPSWAEVVTAFVQAGQGLAAAHQAGLVHRDLKPHNIMRSDDGLVKVLDFGLAREVGADEPTQRSADPSSSASMLGSPFTKTGTVMGTPAYMSPEQLQGEIVDARSDQFSFCVALYEGLYGERPYSGTTLELLTESVRSGNVRPPPRGSKVPAVVRRAVLRGLAPDPQQRWPAMDALLEPLRRQVEPRRRGWATVGVVVGLLGLGAGVGGERYAAWSSRCTGAAERLEGIWDDERRQQVQAALMGTELGHAADTWRRVQERLDAHAEAWAQAHTEVCEATAVRHEQSEEHRDLRMRCLLRARQQLQATVEELTREDPAVVDRAVVAVRSLPTLSRCDDVEVLAAEVPPPEDPAVAQQVVAVEERIVEAGAKQRAGRYDEGLAVASAATAKAKTLDYEPVLVRAWLREAELQGYTGDYEGAAATLRQAYRAALAQRMHLEAAKASTTLMFILGSELARPEQARRWSIHGDALSRAARTGESRAAYLNALGSMLVAEGKYEEARARYRESLALYEQALGPDHPEIAARLNNLANAAQKQGKYDEARALYRKSLALYEQALGTEHPTVGDPLNSLGTIAALQGKYDEAREFYLRSLVIQEQSLRPDQSRVASSLSNLGNVLLKQGLHDEAGGFYRRALDIYEHSLGPEHPRTATALLNLGNVVKRQERHEEAERLYRRSLAIREQALGPAHPSTAEPLINLGSLAIKELRLDEARSLLERSLSIAEEALGPEHPMVGYSLNNLCDVALLSGQYRRGRDLCLRALAIFEQALGAEHFNVGLLRRSLGDLTRMSGAPRASLDWYQRSRVIFEKLRGPRDHHVGRVETRIGKALLALGEPGEALPRLERSLSILRVSEVEPFVLAECRFALARALWTAPAAQGRDRARARALARQAGDDVAEIDVPGVFEVRRAAVEAWLSEHPAPGGEARAR